MKQKLFDSFQRQFSSMNKKIREEDILLFLDKKQNSKFDRETFQELEMRLKDHNKELTGFNFFGTYYLAHQVLSEKEKAAQEQVSQLQKSSNQLLDDSVAVKLSLENIHLRSSKHDQNFVSFETSGNKVNAFNLNEGDECVIYLTKSAFDCGKNLTVTYFNSEGKSIESKSIKIPHSSTSHEKIHLSDGNTLDFMISSVELAQQEAQEDLERQKAFYEELQDFSHTKKRILEKPFPEVYDSRTYVQPYSDQSCSTTLIICVILTGIMLIITLILNFDRCNFIDIFVGVSFFINIYALRIFNLFTAIRFIVVLMVSIFIDIIWETFRLIYYSKNLAQHNKKMRIIGLVFSFILIVLKIVICVFYLKLSKEDQTKGYLSLRDEEHSIHEVDEEDYLQNTLKQSGFRQNFDLNDTLQLHIQNRIQT